MSSPRFKPNNDSYTAIVPAVAKFYEVSEADILKNCRMRKLVEARQLSAYFLKQHDPSFPLGFIGGILKRDHSTITYHLRTAENLINFDRAYKRRYEQLLQKINQALFNTIQKENQLNQIIQEYMNHSNQLNDLKHKAEQVTERLQQIKDVNSLEFKELQKVGNQIGKDIEAIELEQAAHNRRISSLLNNAQEHVAEAMRNPALSFDL